MARNSELAATSSGYSSAVRADLIRPRMSRAGRFQYLGQLDGLGVLQRHGPAHDLGLTLLIAEGAHRYVGAPGRRWLMSLARRLDRRTAAWTAVLPQPATDAARPKSVRQVRWALASVNRGVERKGMDR